MTQILNFGLSNRCCNCYKKGIATAIDSRFIVLITSYFLGFQIKEEK
ncbi:hypothetical protein PORCRE_314 [Porphyromonas crevioricanis JCM 15906]|uniref:Uncharacterized protein n=1 Tax=Porphyromonas crevioricanis JCM 15906 TaxID=1305617 RepID=T1DR06_9PORP|nr:hypothetical protein PORCRE_314 [Porphyromonas crevioricanis JCM 15906]